MSPTKRNRTVTTAANAREFTLALINLTDLANLTDTIVTVSPGADSRDRRRRVVTGALKRGLVRYVARRPGSERLTIAYTAPTDAPGAGAAPGA